MHHQEKHNFCNVPQHTSLVISQSALHLCCNRLALAIVHQVALAWQRIFALCKALVVFPHIAHCAWGCSVVWHVVGLHCKLNFALALSTGLLVAFKVHCQCCLIGLFGHLALCICFRHEFGLGYSSALTLGCQC